MAIEPQELPPWLVAFREQFIDTGKVPAKFYDYLLEAHRLNEMAEQNPDAISAEAANSLLAKAQEFVDVAEQFLKGAGGKVEQ